MIDTYIDGKTKIFGLIGSPIKHTFSPIIHNTITKVLIDSNHKIEQSVYIPMHVEENNLCDAIKGAFALGICGLNITVPHKTSVMEYLHDIDNTAKIIGAVNTLKYTDKGYIGYNTDIIGVLETFKQNGVLLQGKNIMILGAGGGAAAVLAAILSEDVKEIYVVNRTHKNADTLAENTKKYYNKDITILSYEELSKVKSVDIVIQTTSVGLSKGDTLIKDKTFFEHVNVCLDIIYNPWKTTFLEDAQTFGVTCINGFDMLVYQAMAAYSIFHEITLDQMLKLKIANELKAYFNAYA